MKNYFEKLKMALWVFSPIVIVLSIYTIYLSGPVNRNGKVEITNSFEFPRKPQRSHTFHHAAETGTSSATEM